MAGHYARCRGASRPAEPIRRSRRQRAVNRLAPWLLALAVSSLAVACGGSGAQVATTAAGHWRSLPAAPVSAREQAVLAWTGREVIVVGGSIAPPCPPGASCAGPRQPVADGAAFDPAAGTWRPIADAPVAFDIGQAVTVGDVVYVWAMSSQVPPETRRVPGLPAGDRSLAAVADAVELADARGSPPSAGRSSPTP